ncbi:MAG: YncE family protein [Pseudomonadales bacterium]
MFKRSFFLAIFLVLSGCKLVVVNAGGGNVTSATIALGNPAIDCGADCEHSYGYNPPVETLTAVPDANHVFAGWFNGPCTGTGTCQVQVGVDGEISVEARFRLAALTIDPIADQTLLQDFAPFNLQANAAAGGGQGAVTYAVANSNTDIVDVQIDGTTGELTVTSVGGKFGKALVHVTASVTGGNAATSFEIDIPMPQNPVFACGTSAETLTEEDIPNSYTLFESGHTRPLALSPNGQLLFATNTPANCLEIYSTEDDNLTLVSSVSVGLEPIAVAAKSDTEIWVVNHLSDSVSVVDIKNTPRVVRTLLVGDEPRDIVFGGPNKDKAFITAAFRGQNHPTYDAETDHRTPGLGRADVWVFDSNNLGASLGGDPTTIINLFSDSPRSLAVTPDGNTVYAAGFFSGNQTTSVLSQFINGNRPAPLANQQGIAAPLEGLIVKYDGNNFVDENGTVRPVSFNLPDRDVFLIDASANPPVPTGTREHVGTTLFNMAVHPTDGRLFVSNTEARNHVRFEGPGVLGTTVRGHAVENRITIIDGTTVTPRHLNPHVDFSLPEGQVIPASEKMKSLAQPGEMVFDALGVQVFVTAFGSSKVGIFLADELANNTFTPGNNIEIPGGGTSGIVYSPEPQRLYVMSRFDNSISIVRIQDKQVINTTAMFSPESSELIAGRHLLYDADFTSGNGTQSCGQCHVFGDFDNIAWDLGNPDANVEDNPNPFELGFGNPTFHPMKGPMTTQTLRGIADSGPLHWRGDKTGRDSNGNPIPGETIESAAFKQFNPAFVGLIGRATELGEDDLQDFTDFSLRLTLPPNPNQNLDNSYTSSQAAGRNTYVNKNNVDGGRTCEECHTLDESQNFFGTSGLSSFEGRTQEAKIPHLRNVYAKIGMFGSGQDEVKGFGFLHGGDVPTVDQFISAGVFNLTAQEIINVTNFQMVFPTNLAPIVGQQVTLTSTNSGALNTRINTLIARALAGDADLIVKGGDSNGPISARLLANGNFLTANDEELTANEMRAVANTPGRELTFTAVPVGHGIRLAPSSS